VLFPFLILEPPVAVLGRGDIFGLPRCAQGAVDVRPANLARLERFTAFRTGSRRPRRLSQGSPTLRVFFAKVGDRGLTNLSQKTDLSHSVERADRRGLSCRPCCSYLPMAASTSPIRALTSLETRPGGKGFSGLKRIVPLAVSYPVSSSRCSSNTAGL
jgi:hypothetical protein